jgi:hypothetical protein
MGLDMKNIKTDEALPGMVTAQDILGANGHLLLPAGTTLTTRYIRMLHAREIPSVAIESEAETTPAENKAALDPAGAHDARIDRLVKRFKYQDMNHPFIDELVRVCTSRLANRA